MAPKKFVDNFFVRNQRQKKILHNSFGTKRAIFLLLNIETNNCQKTTTLPTVSKKVVFSGQALTSPPPLSDPLKKNFYFVASLIKAAIFAI